MTIGDWISIGVMIVSLMTSLVAVIFSMMQRNASGTAQRVEKRSDKQDVHAEVLAGHSARISQLENDRGKIADALDRLARIEEWRVHSMPRLDEVEQTVENTARGMVAFDERMKTVFKRLDAMTEHMKDLPRDVAVELRSMFKHADSARRTANG